MKKSTGASRKGRILEVILLALLVLVLTFILTSIT